MKIKMLLTLILAGVFTGCGSPQPTAMTPVQANDLFSSLDMKTILSRCGKPKNIKYRVLEYPFGDFVFDAPLRETSRLMDAYMTVPSDPHQVDWTSLSDSVDEQRSQRVSHDSYARMMPSMAALEKISVYEYEGKKALQILQTAPCLLGVRNDH